jgi:integrase
MSSSNPRRVPVASRGRRVPGLCQTTRQDGSVFYEYRGRLGGRVRTIGLDAVTKTDAIAEAESLRSGVREKRIEITADRRKTVAEAAAEYLVYLASLEGTRGERSPRTREDAEAKLRLYLLPQLGALRMAQVSERDVARVANAHRDMSESTVRSVLSVGSQYFAWGVRERYCDHNPVKRARDVYGDTLLPASEPKPQRALTDAEIMAGLKKLSDAFRPVVAFTAETGLRISEVLGLVWSNCDLDAGSIVVEAQLQNGKRRRTKTKREREISISEAAVEILRAHRRTTSGSPTRGIGAVAPDRLVFVTKTGRPQSRRNVLRAWQNAVGIEGVGLHTLRHSFVSRLEEKGVSVAIAAELVGHSRVTTTQAVYTRMRGDRTAKLQAQRAALQAAASS